MIPIEKKVTLQLLTPVIAPFSCSMSESHKSKWHESDKSVARPSNTISAGIENSQFYASQRQKSFRIRLVDLYSIQHLCLCPQYWSKTWRLFSNKAFSLETELNQRCIELISLVFIIGWVKNSSFHFVRSSYHKFIWQINLLTDSF